MHGLAWAEPVPSLPRPLGGGWWGQRRHVCLSAFAPTTEGRKQERRAPRAAQRKPLPRLEHEDGAQRPTAGFSAAPGGNWLLADPNVCCWCSLSAVPGQCAQGRSSGCPPARGGGRPALPQRPQAAAPAPRGPGRRSPPGRPPATAGRGRPAAPAGFPCARRASCLAGCPSRILLGGHSRRAQGSPQPQRTVGRTRQCLGNQTLADGVSVSKTVEAVAAAVHQAPGASEITLP